MRLPVLLQPYELQLFTFEPLQKKLALLKAAKPDPAGRLWLVPAFWGKGLDINIKAKALLAVAELLASSDSRNKEVAELINEQYLHLKTLPETRV
ncbi:type IV toxin-antitoxin system AbiEi family antitoxin [Vibrio natriegens]|uniref:type IV toxin-antitoxin system AbiEi family antitoxin n=1 Tax=Vibrio natriegens TaxID=691 RepID=UPI0021E7FA32|nr:type IV toxin-antitoxin system AbiEi family antitoxin [Vibrio natriegens]UYI47689.1 type IV toxin-antitoxin system AbiEi family antitoxin [Vibrio natriegens]